MPARSKASTTAPASAAVRSIASASLGPTPKNPASKSPTSARNDPWRTYLLPGVSGSGSYEPARSQPRSAGKSDTASRPSTAHLPQAVRGIDSARIAARHPHHRHRLGQFAFQLRQPPSGAPQIRCEALKVINVFVGARHWCSVFSQRRVLRRGWRRVGFRWRRKDPRLRGPGGRRGPRRALTVVRRVWMRVVRCGLSSDFHSGWLSSVCSSRVTSSKRAIRFCWSAPVVATPSRLSRCWASAMGVG